MYADIIIVLISIIDSFFVHISLAHFLMTVLDRFKGEKNAMPR